MATIPLQDSDDEAIRKAYYDSLPDGTVSILIKNNGKVLAKGLTIPTIDKDTPDEDVHMAMQRVHDVGNICVNTIFYTLKGHNEKDVKPELV